MRIRLLQPPPIKLTVGRDAYRIELQRQAGAHGEGGYIAAFIEGQDRAHYLLSAPIAGADGFEAVWSAGFDHTAGVSATVDAIVGELMRLGLAEEVGATNGDDRASVI